LFIGTSSTLPGIALPTGLFHKGRIHLTH